MFRVNTMKIVDRAQDAVSFTYVNNHCFVFFILPLSLPLCVWRRKRAQRSPVPQSKGDVKPSDVNRVDLGNEYAVRHDEEKQVRAKKKTALDLKHLGADEMTQGTSQITRSKFILILNLLCVLCFKRADVTSFPLQQKYGVRGSQRRPRSNKFDQVSPWQCSIKKKKLVYTIFKTTTVQLVQYCYTVHLPLT